jgi:hypothetical protein
VSSPTQSLPASFTTSRTLAIRGFRLILAVAVLTAVFYQVADGLWRGLSVTDYFSYFTELSNLFAAAVFLHGAAVPAERRSHTVEMVRGAAVVYMLTTGIVFAVLLSGHKPTVPWANAILHQAMPLAVAIDWLLLPPRVHLEPRRALLWMSFPIAYVVYTLARGAIVGWYPYYFLDPTRHGGYVAVAIASVAIALGIVALIAAVAWAGNRLGRHETAV